MAETALRAILARFGVQFDDRQLRRGTRSINEAVRGLRAFGAAIGGAVIVRGIGRFVASTIRLGDDLDKTSQQLGITAEDFEALSHSANLAGVDAAAFANGLGILQRRANDAATGSAEAVDSFRQLGIEWQDAEGNLLSGPELLANVADGMVALDNPAERTALSMELMGRSGRRLLPMLTQGSDAIREQAEESRRLTGDLDDYRAVSVELTDNIARYNQALLGLRARLAVVLLPIIDRAVRTLTRWSVAIRELTEQSHMWQIALVALGVAAVGLGIKLTLAFAGPLITVGLFAAALVIIALIIDDLWVAIEGGDSVIGSLIDEVLAAIGVWWRFENMVNEVRQAVQDLWEVLQAGGQFFAGIFGAEAPEEVSAGYIRGAHGAGRGVREFFSPGAERERLETEAQEAQLRRRSRRLAHRRRREEAGGALEGEFRSGRAIIEGGRIVGRTPAQRFQGGQWVNVGDTSVDVSVTTAATDPEEVGRIARRETTRALEQERRATLAALEGAGGEAS